MSEKFLEYLMKIIDFLYSKEVGIEVFKVIFTALFGFVTFKIYQMYRNKEDNSKLYIQMIKLEKEIYENQEVLRKIIDFHSEYYLLHRVFRGEGSENIYDFYELIDSLSNYVHQDIIYDNGEPIDAEYVYLEKPYELINHLSYVSRQVEFKGEEYLGQLDSINVEIERCENSSIFNLLMEIEKKAKKIDIKDQEIYDSIQYLIIKLEKFNSKEDTQKGIILDEFCSQLLDENNNFSKYLKLFKNYKNLSRKLHKEKQYKKIPKNIEFKVWQQQEMGLLSMYSSEDYLALEEYYHKNRKIKIGNWELEKAEKLYKEMQSIYDKRILIIRDVLKKTLNRTNWIFGKI